MKKNKIHLVPIVAVILVMVLIFLLSHQPVAQSARLSSGIAEMIVSIAQYIMPDWDVDMDSFHHLLRKSAHFFSYFLLGMLGINALWKNGGRTYLTTAAAFLFCILFALSDEAHQFFVPGRGAQLRDVAIDSAGAAAGILAYIIIAGLRRYIPRLYQ